MRTFILPFLVFSASLVDALIFEDIFRRQADPSSISSAPDTCTSCTNFASTLQTCNSSLACDCTTAVDALAQTCINCLAAISEAPDAIQNVTTAYNTICQSSNVAKLTIPQIAASTAAPTSSGTRTSVFDGPTNSAGLPSTPVATPTGGGSGSTNSVPSPVPQTTIAGGSGPSTTNVPGSIGSGSSGQSTGSPTGQGGTTSGGSQSKQPNKARFLGGVVAAVAAVIFFG